VICKNISKKILGKRFFISFFLVKKTSNAFGKRKVHGCKISFNYQNLSRATPQQKRIFLFLLNFLFPLKIGLLNILLLLVLVKYFQNFARQQNWFN